MARQTQTQTEEQVAEKETGKTGLRMALGDFKAHVARAVACTRPKENNFMALVSFEGERIFGTDGYVAYGGRLPFRVPAPVLVRARELQDVLKWGGTRDEDMAVELEVRMCGTLTEGLVVRFGHKRLVLLSLTGTPYVPVESVFDVSELKPCTIPFTARGEVYARVLKTAGDVDVTLFQGEKTYTCMVLECKTPGREGIFVLSGLA